MNASRINARRRALRLSGALVLNVVLVIGCNASPSSGEPPSQIEKVPSPENNTRPPRVKTLGSSWTPSPDVIEKVGLTSDQVTRIAEIESEFSARIGEAQRKEQRAALRYVRAVSEEPILPERVAEMQQQLDLASLGRLHVALDRVRAMRESLPLDQWLALIQADPSAGRVGGFKPRFLGAITVGDPQADDRTPSAE